MPADRDLIAMGRRHAQHAADEQPEIGCMRDVLSAVLDALEAAQRPPLGYMAVEDSEEPRSPTGRWVVPMSAIFPTAEECQPTLELYKPLDGVTPARDARRFVAEVREVADHG